MRMRTCPMRTTRTGIDGQPPMRRRDTVIRTVIAVAVVLAAAWWVAQALIRYVTLD